MRKARYRRLTLLVLAIFCLFQIRSFASVPSPTTDFYLDEVGVLDEKTKENINSTNKQLEDKTGSQVIVMALDNPEGLDGNAYGTEIFNSWQIGDKDKDNGVLILLLLSNETRNQINIITGYGIEGRLNDGKVGRIIDNFMLDRLREGDYSTALNEGFNAVVGEIALEYDIELEKDYTAYQKDLAPTYNDDGLSLKTLLIVLIIFIIVSSIINKNNPGGGGGFTRRRGPRRMYFPRGGFGGSWGGGFGGGSGGGFSGGGGSSGGGGAGRSF